MLPLSLSSRVVYLPLLILLLALVSCSIHGYLVGFFRDCGLVYISRPQPCAKRESEIALFPGPTQLSITCSMEKQESLLTSLM